MPIVMRVSNPAAAIKFSGVFMSGNKNSGRPKNRTPCKTIRKGFRLTEKQHEIFDRARGDVPLSTYIVELAMAMAMQLKIKPEVADEK